MKYVIYNKNFSSIELEKYNIFIDENSIIEEGVKIESFVKVKNSKIGSSSFLCSYSHIENSRIGQNVLVKSSCIIDSCVGDETTVGPYANIHTNSVIKKCCRIGNFVEIKNSIVKDNSKLAHLTYVGDAEIGENCNIGCGVIFCNYNGEIKQKSTVGDNVFIGSNVNIIAPVEICDGAYIAAGSTINKDVKENEFSIARARQVNKETFDNPYTRKLNKNKH